MKNKSKCISLSSSLNDIVHFFLLIILNCFQRATKYRNKNSRHFKTQITDAYILLQVRYHIPSNSSLSSVCFLILTQPAVFWPLISGQMYVKILSGLLGFPVDKAVFTEWEGACVYLIVC